MNLFAFLSPFSTYVWILMIMAGVSVSIVMYLIARFVLNSLSHKDLMKWIKIITIKWALFNSAFSPIIKTIFLKFKVESIRDWRVEFRGGRNTICFISSLPLVFNCLLGAARLWLSSQVKLNLSQKQNCKDYITSTEQDITTNSKHSPWPISFCCIL